MLIEYLYFYCSYFIFLGAWFEIITIFPKLTICKKI